MLIVYIKNDIIYIKFPNLYKSFDFQRGYGLLSILHFKHYGFHYVTFNISIFLRLVCQGKCIKHFLVIQ